MFKQRQQWQQVSTASFGGPVFSVNVDKILQYPPLGAYRENSRASVSGHFLKKEGFMLARYLRGIICIPTKESICIKVFVKCRSK